MNPQGKMSRFMWYHFQIKFKTTARTYAIFFEVTLNGTEGRGRAKKYTQSQFSFNFNSTRSNFLNKIQFDVVLAVFLNNSYRNARIFFIFKKYFSSFELIILDHNTYIFFSVHATQSLYYHIFLFKNAKSLVFFCEI